jgi:hypothetical protein
MDNFFEEKTKNQGTSHSEASQKSERNGDMASEWEELVELDDVQLATGVVGGKGYAGGVGLVTARSPL